jgi:predicted transposase YdaD
MYQQPYDTSMKAMLQEDAPEIVPQILPGAIFIDALDIEVLPAVVRADQVYQILYHNVPHILHLEFQSTSDAEMAERLLHYHVGLLDRHKRPVISIVIYLFECPTPTPPFRELSGNREILTFYYQVINLWMVDARQYVQEHVLSMYSLLPTMKNADSSLLLQALEELIEYYKGSEAKLIRRLLWFSTLLKQMEKVLPKQGLEKVRKRLDFFDKMLEENDFVIRQRALGLEEGERKGKIEGKIEGEIYTSQQILLVMLQKRYPMLAKQIRPRIERTSQVTRLQDAILQLIDVSNEEQALRLLDEFLD